jgi:hypothetical protein
VKESTGVTANQTLTTNIVFSPAPISDVLPFMGRRAKYQTVLERAAARKTRSTQAAQNPRYVFCSIDVVFPSALSTVIKLFAVNKTGVLMSVERERLMHHHQVMHYRPISPISLSLITHHLPP